MEFIVGDLVTRKSYNNDIVFKIDSINGGKAILKGVVVRLMADSPLSDLKKYDKTKESVINEELNINKIKSLKRHR